MPAKSEKQAKFMQAVAHSPSFAKKVGVPQSVGKEFSKARGGEMAESKKESKREAAFKKGGKAPSGMAKKGAALAGLLAMARARAAMAGAGGAGGAGGPPGMGGGAPPSPAPSPDMSAAPDASGGGAGGPPGMKKGGKVKMKDSKGGLLPNKKSAEGIDKKGKTRALREDMDGGQGVSVGPTTGKAKGGKMKMKKYAKGGAVFRKVADGIASKGKTKGAQVTMAKGGKMKGC